MRDPFDSMTTQRHFAVFSGAAASAASLFGKLTGLPQFEEIIIIRLVCFALMVLANGMVWTFYVKALHVSQSSLSATVISAATNYLLSAIYGLVIFREVTSLFWWTGAGLILLGLILIIRSQDREELKRTVDASGENNYSALPEKAKLR